MRIFVPPFCPRGHEPDPRFNKELKELILEAIANGGASTDELASWLGISPTRAGRLVGRLRQEGVQIIKWQRRFWKIVGGEHR